MIVGSPWPGLLGLAPIAGPGAPPLGAHSQLQMEINPPARLRPVSWVSPFCLPRGPAGWSSFRSTTFLQDAFHPVPRWTHLSPSEPAHILSAPPGPSALCLAFACQILTRDAEFHKARAGPLGSSGLHSMCVACHTAAPVPPTCARRPVPCHQHGTRRAHASLHGLSLCQACPSPLSSPGKPSAGP